MKEDLAEITKCIEKPYRKYFVTKWPHYKPSKNDYTDKTTLLQISNGKIQSYHKQKKTNLI